MDKFAAYFFGHPVYPSPYPTPFGLQQL